MVAIVRITAFRVRSSFSAPQWSIFTPPLTFFVQSRKRLLATPVVWLNGQIYVLQAFIDASGDGWQIINVMAINNAGQIAGNGVHNGVTSAFILTPQEHVITFKWSVEGTLRHARRTLCLIVSSAGLHRSGHADAAYKS